MILIKRLKDINSKYLNLLTDKEREDLMHKLHNI